MEQNVKKGLTTEEVQRRQSEGRNVLTQGKQRSLLLIIMEQMRSPLLLLLLVASVISFATNQLADGLIILIVVVINVVIGTAQEVSAQKSVDSLRSMTVATAVVIRDGVQQEISSEDLVVGDYVMLEAGAVVPADIRLVATSSLKINESALTGESVAEEKDALQKSGPDTPIGERLDKAFMTTLVEYGRGEGVVEAIGDNTEIGKISGMLHTITKNQTPLQQNLDKLSKVLGLAGIVLCILLYILQVAVYQSDVIETLMISIAFAVAVIPEGLATVVTLVLSSGIKKMSERSAIVKQLYAVETLGAVDVICTDKTGTLTQNRMTVVRWYLNGREAEADDAALGGADPSGKVFWQLVTGFCVCNDSTYDTETQEGTGDPTEIAFVKYGEENREDYEAVMGGYRRFDEMPFDSDRKMMTVLCASGEEGKAGNISFTKGAIDSVIGRCDRILDENGVRPITQEDIKAAVAAADAMSGRALRVLSLAYREGDTAPQEKDMIFVGLAGMIDPPKEQVKETIDECHGAGITVAMITGDYKITAFAIAQALDIADDISQCISGQEIDAMDPEEFRKNVVNYRVFARVSPENKVQIVQAFQSHGKIVSMTGDGVNDAPSLKAADIGVSMGKGGTEVAKDAAEMILVDDNFITIRNAVMEGRNLFNNIRKSVIYLLRSNCGEVVLMAAAMLTGLASPLTTIQILWVNLMTDTAPSLALGMDKSTDEVMKEKPRDVSAGLLSKRDYISIVIQGIVGGGTALFAYLLPLILNHKTGAAMPAALRDPQMLAMCRTYCFTTLAVNEMLMAYVCKTPGKLAFFSKESWNNRALNLTCLIGILLQLFVLVCPPMRALLKLANVTAGDIGIILLTAVCGVMINALLSLVRGKDTGTAKKDS